MPADQNYLLARWTLVQGMYPEFFWQALQCLEKYYKAGLLVNEFGTGEFGHSLVRLHEKHDEVFADLAFREFRKPENLREDLWTDESVPDFLARIERQGAPESRYGIVSWARRTDDLFKLDLTVQNLRKLTIGLDWIVGDDWPPTKRAERHVGKSYREAWRDEYDLDVRGEIERLESPIEPLGKTWADIIHFWNFAFSRDADDLERPPPRHLAPVIGPIRNAFLYLCYEELTRKEREPDPVTVEGVRWLLDGRRMKLSRNDRDLLLRLV